MEENVKQKVENRGGQKWRQGQDTPALQKRHRPTGSFKGPDGARKPESSGS
jgi:hypothetical protein